MRPTGVLVLGAGLCLWVGLGIRGHAQSGGPAQSSARPVEPDSPATSSPVVAGPQANGASPETIVPRLMKFSGVLHDATGKPPSGSVDVTFALYNTEAGGDALWFETQSVQADELGHYTALLGAMHADGLPVELFTSGEVRWLGIQVGQEREQQPRVLLVSVPYALKAGDAETLGGKPASAYMLSDSQNATALAISSAISGSGNVQPGVAGKNDKTRKASVGPLTSCTSTVTTDDAATVNSIPVFTTACNIESSAISQSSGYVGIGTTAPAALLHIFGATASDSDARYNLILGDSTSAAAGTGGGIDFSGYYSGTTSKAGFANIRGVKENATQGNYASALIFDTRANGGNQTERMRISSAGNLGIGTTNPAFPLDVNGVINSASGYRVAGGATSGNYLRANGTTFVSSAILTSDLPGSFSGFANPTASIGLTSATGTATTAMRSDAAPALSQSISPTWTGTHTFTNATYSALFTGGNVGIGNPSPAYKLDIIDTSSDRAHLKLSRGETTNINGSADLMLGNRNLWQVGTDWEQNGTNDFFVYQAGPSAYMFINSSGNVGIGTTTPTANLEVNGTAKFDSSVTFAAGQSITGTESITGGLSTTGSVGVGTTTPKSELDVYGGAAIGSYAGTTAAPSNGLIVSGNVGIGTASPQEKLHVNGSMTLDPAALGSSYLYFRNNAGTADLAAMAVNNSDNTLYMFSRGSGLQVRNANNTSALLHITDAGNVGIGTMTPGATLEVNGTAKFDGTLSSTVATGTAPLQVSSATQVANLNASLLNGLSSAAFLPVTGGKLSGSLLVGGTTAQSQNLVLEVQTTAGTDALTVNTSGTVGIGTGTGTHITTAGLSTDFAGTIQVVQNSAWSSATKTFITSFSSPPVCVVTQVNPSYVSAYYYVSYPASAPYVSFTLSNYNTTGYTYTFNYICVGNPN